MSEEDIRAERLKKLEILKAAGMEAYPAESRRTHWINEFVSDFPEIAAKKKEVSLVGRVMSLRGQGGIIFVTIFDGTGRIQVVFQKSEMIGHGGFDLFVAAADVGDFIEVRGPTYITKRGEQSLGAHSWKMLSKSLLPIPDQWFGLKDAELKLRLRPIDILLDPELQEMIKRRARFWQAAREFYLARGFLEVETPALETTPGGADARPFKTHHNTLGIDLYLRISAGELWQKRLLIAGFPKVFEIGRIFRNEGQSREHLQDYTQLESYEAYADAKSGMKFVQELYRHVAKETYGQYSFEIGEHKVDLAEEWPILDLGTLIKKEYGIDPISVSEKEAIQAVHDAKIQFGETLNKARAIDHLWKHIRKTITGPAFLTGVPVYMEPLAKRVYKNTEVVDRIQVILAGSEMGKGYSELNDPTDQDKRLNDQQDMRDKGDEEAQRLDLDYIGDMQYGMPPAFGFGVSERLFSFLENKPAHETQIFPLLRPRA